MTKENVQNVPKVYTDPKTGKFVKGNPGGGRPKDAISVVDEIKRQLMEEVDMPNGEKRTKLKLLAERAIQKAVRDGDGKMIRDVMDRIDGRATQKVEADVSGDVNYKITGIVVK